MSYFALWGNLLTRGDTKVCGYNKKICNIIINLSQTKQEGAWSERVKFKFRWTDRALKMNSYVNPQWQQRWAGTWRWTKNKKKVTEGRKMRSRQEKQTEEGQRNWRLSASDCPLSSTAGLSTQRKQLRWFRHVVRMPPRPSHWWFAKLTQTHKATRDGPRAHAKDRITL